MLLLDDMSELYTHQPQILPATSCLELVEFGIERIKNQGFTSARVNGGIVSKFGMSIDRMRNSIAAAAEIQLTPEDETVRQFADRFTDLGSCSLMGFKFLFGRDQKISLPAQAHDGRTTLLTLSGEGGFNIYDRKDQQTFTEVITAPGDQMTLELGTPHSVFGLGSADNPRIVAYFIEG